MSPTHTEADTKLQVSRVIHADREAVFRAWTDPAQLERWFGPDGTTIGVAEVDLSVGGSYRIRIDSEQMKQHTVSGVYREIDPPSRLAFTWDWEENEFRMGAPTLVTVELHVEGDATRVEITHERLPNAEARDGHRQGWESSFDCLERLFA